MSVEFKGGVASANRGICFGMVTCPQGYLSNDSFQLLAQVWVSGVGLDNAHSDPKRWEIHAVFSAMFASSGSKSKVDQLNAVMPIPCSCPLNGSVGPCIAMQGC